MSVIKKVIDNILNNNGQFCALCFETIEGKALHIQDDVVLNKHTTAQTLSLSEILTCLLGEEIFNTALTFETLCKQCVKAAVNSYNFITMAKQNSETLSKTLNSLVSSIVDNSVNDTLAYESLFVTINTNNYSTKQFYDSKRPVTSLSAACKRLESIATPKLDTLKIIPQTKIKKEIIKEQAPVIKPRKKHKSDSFLMKTKDMMCDNDGGCIKCIVCCKIYPTISNLRNHYIRVHAPKDYKCDICGRRFGSMSILETHKDQSHCTVVCSECGRTFNNRHTLKMHEISHNLKLVCQNCGRVYRSQTTFKKHIDLNICSQKTRANPSQAKFTCDYCNKKYTQKVSLRVHIQYEHGNYKAHVCKWCNKKFWAKSRLNAHIVKHTQEKKFQCTTCGGKFVSKESLLYHTRTHTGEKPYTCEICDSRFLSASRRADHVKRHHLVKIVVCDICHNKFPAQMLDEHKQTHYKTENEDDGLNKKSMPDLGNVSEDVKVYLNMSEEEDYGARPNYVLSLQSLS